MTSDQISVTHATVGKLDRDADAGSILLWFYDRKTGDPITGKTDDYAQVIENGKVSDVTFVAF